MVRIIDTSTIVDPEFLSRDDRAWIYNGLDTCVTLEVLHKIERYLDPVTRATYEFSKSLQAPILDMTMRGIKVDLAQRDEVLHSFKQQIILISNQLDRITFKGLGLKINWRSPAQLKSLFYDVFNLKPIVKRNAQGKMAPTINREALEKLSSHYYAEPLCIRLIALRDLDKKRMFLETGIDADGRMRTNFNIAGTVTGRLASSASDYGTGTNQQNIDRELRSVFVADPGMKFANLDLEQADARNVGAICWNLFVEKFGEKWAGAYLDACESGDLHTTVCRMAWTDRPWTDDPKANRAIADVITYRALSYRDLAKRLGHGTNYYGKPPTMAKHSKVQRSAIEDFQAAYFKAFPAIQQWHHYVKNELHTNQSLTTLFGRRRIFFGNPYDESTLREAIAYEPQSMTADEIDTGLLQLWRANICQLLTQVHDSVLIQYPEDREDEILPQAIKLLRAPLSLARGREFCVPVDAKVGWNWGDASKENVDGLVKWTGHDSRKRSG